MRLDSDPIDLRNRTHAWPKSMKRDVRSTFRPLQPSWVDPETEDLTPAKCLSVTSATRSVVYVLYGSSYPQIVRPVSSWFTKQVSESELKEFFADFGPVKYCQIVKDHSKKWSRGYAHVTIGEREGVEI